MKYKFIVSFVFAALSVSALSAQETNKTGTVSVIKDFSGKVTAIKLIVTSYDIKLDENSKQLIYMDGERTLVTGMLNDEGGKKLIALDPPRQTQIQTGEAGTSSAAKSAGNQSSGVPISETGIISITKDAAGQISAMKVIVDFRAIKPDENGKRLESMDGKKVKIKYDASFDAGLVPVTDIELVEDAAPPASAPSSTK